MISSLENVILIQQIQQRKDPNIETMINAKMLELGENSSEIRDLYEYGNKRKAEIGEDKVMDFSLGNPNVPCPERVTRSFIHLLEETGPAALHGYTSAPGYMEVRKAVSEYVNERYGIECEPSDFYMTAGAAASLAIALKSVCNEGNEVIVFAPYFPEYRVFIENAGGVAKEVPVSTEDFQPDFHALKKALGPETAAVIVNSPNNPTGAVLTEESLKELAQVLDHAQARFGNEIILISDEPYRELVYDGIKPALPAHYYDNTIVCYSWSKSLSMPGERIGYIMVSPKAKHRQKIFSAVCGSGRSLGYVCAPALMQYVTAMNLGVTSDLEEYAKNRQLIYDIVTGCGFEAARPDGAFYLFVKSPSGDGKEFSERAKKYELLLVPSDSFGIEGYVRISYCVSREQIERSEEAFRALAADYGLADN